MNIYLLSFLWIAWCAVHSLLINRSVLQFIQEKFPRLTPFYRLLFNGWSLVTFIPLVIATRMTEGQVVVAWSGFWVIPRVVLLLLVVLLFIGGAKQYDLGYFLGLKQLHSGEARTLLSDDDQFSETGILGLTRHPWYFGSLLLLWTMLSEFPLPVFWAVSIMSIYLVLGTILEERKLVAEYGDSYRAYRQRVSMLFPWKWLVGRVSSSLWSLKKN